MPYGQVEDGSGPVRKKTTKSRNGNQRQLNTSILMRSSIVGNYLMNSYANNLGLGLRQNHEDEE